jgi:DNA-binding MarR family transcriptional regulator
MELDKKLQLVTEFCQATYELKYKLRRMFQVKLKEAGISISFEVLEVMKILSSQEGTNQQELADLLFKDKSSMTYLIDNMVKAGYAVRQEDETDRRNKLIILTDKAHELRLQLVPMATACYMALSEDVADTDLKDGIAMLAKMNHSLMLGTLV